MLCWEQSQSVATMLQERAWVEIDLGALAANVQYLRRSLSPQTDLMTVVKADAYGHGAVTVARTVLQAGANWLGVATIPEGIELREAGVTAPILVLGGVNAPEEIRAIARWQLQPSLISPRQALIFAEVLAAMGETIPVHLKVDTGMSRLGVDWRSAVEFVQLVRGLPNLTVASLYSHLATADDPDPTVMRQQHQRFETVIAQLRNVGFVPPRLHFANSAGTLSDRSLHYDMVRVGLATYGLYPAPHLEPGTPRGDRLQPVMQVKARITQVKTIAAGTGVSYGHHFIAHRETRLAIVGIGYADGVPRNLSDRMTVLLQGQRVRQVGAITMDMLMLDVTDLPDVHEGEVVTLLGRDGNEQISAHDWASVVGTISWEILCGFKHRLPRIAKA